MVQLPVLVGNPPSLGFLGWMKSLHIYQDAPQEPTTGIDLIKKRLNKLLSLIQIALSSVTSVNYLILKKFVIS